MLSSALLCVSLSLSQSAVHSVPFTVCCPLCPFHSLLSTLSRFFCSSLAFQSFRVSVLLAVPVLICWFSSPRLSVVIVCLLVAYSILCVCWFFRCLRFVFWSRGLASLGALCLKISLRVFRLFCFCCSRLLCVCVCHFAFSGVLCSL